MMQLIKILSRASLRSRASVGLLCVVLGSCGTSPPTRFFTLSASPPVTPTTTDAASEAALLRVQPIVIPAELDRLELVTHAGPNLVRVAGTERWAAPLDEQIRRVLSEDLRLRLPPHSVADPYEPVTTDPRRLLSIEIGEFEVDQNCAATLHSDWTLRTSGKSDTVTSGSEDLSLPSSGACPDHLASAMSVALGMLADRLVLETRARPAGPSQTPTTSTNSPTAPRSVKPSGVDWPGTGSAPSPTG